MIHSNNNVDQNLGSLPWVLIEKQSKDEKQVIEKIKFPTGFSSNINKLPLLIELYLFLGLQICQRNQGIFIS
jgi:hypothetical protein